MTASPNSIFRLHCSRIYQSILIGRGPTHSTGLLIYFCGNNYRTGSSTSESSHAQSSAHDYPCATSSFFPSRSCPRSRRGSPAKPACRSGGWSRLPARARAMARVGSPPFRGSRRRPRRFSVVIVAGPSASAVCQSWMSGCASLLDLCLPIRHERFGQHADCSYRQMSAPVVPPLDGISL